MSEFRSLLTKHLQGVVHLSPEQLASLESHYELLVRWNNRMNLSSIRGIEEVVIRHYGESLFTGGHLPAGKLSIADVGSGAGFPGYPIGVLRPECAVTLLESNTRKCVFLREASRNHANIQVIEGRAESQQETYEWVVGRAVNWDELFPSLLRFGRNVALLLSDSDALRLRQDLRIAWQPQIRLPWGERRVLLLGNVPRGT